MNIYSRRVIGTIIVPRQTAATDIKHAMFEGKIIKDY